MLEYRIHFKHSMDLEITPAVLILQEKSTNRRFEIFMYKFANNLFHKLGELI